MKGKKTQPRALAILAAVLAAGILAWFFLSLGNLRSGQIREGRRQLETALRRAAVACYAAEGAYPDSLEDLTGRYGIQIDKENYTVFYEVFAENLMPDITVLVKEK